MNDNLTAEERKQCPIATGVLDYFPDAIVEIARVSWAGNEQHNPGTPLHWDRAKSGDESDAMMRHYMNKGKWDKDGQRHSAKMAWRALAFLQKEIEQDRKNADRLSAFDGATIAKEAFDRVDRLNANFEEEENERQWSFGLPPCNCPAPKPSIP